MTRPQPKIFRTGLRTGLAAAILAGSLTLALPADAWAQAASQPESESFKPPRPAKLSNPPVIRNFLVAGVVVVSIVAATIIPAKRGHQD